MNMSAKSCKIGKWFHHPPIPKQTSHLQFPPGCRKGKTQTLLEMMKESYMHLGLPWSEILFPSNSGVKQGATDFLGLFAKLFDEILSALPNDGRVLKELGEDGAVYGWRSVLEGGAKGHGRAPPDARPRVEAARITSSASQMSGLALAALPTSVPHAPFGIAISLAQELLGTRL